MRPSQVSHHSAAAGGEYGEGSVAVSPASTPAEALHVHSGVVGRRLAAHVL